MTAEEKLECPLLRCTQRFFNHELMLSHLATCDYLPSGEYWCYDHMRVERFDDVKCKRCLGHPSKRRRMLSVAKHFFHSLGSKSKKAPSGPGLSNPDAPLPPPPSYDSLHPLPPSDPTELSATEISEIDSTEVAAPPSPTAAFDAVIDPQSLLVPELESSAPSSSNTFVPWQVPPSYGIGPLAPLLNTNTLDQLGFQNPLSRPSLQVDTHGLQGRHQLSRPLPRPMVSVSRSKGLSPSSSVRSNASNTSNTSSTSNASATSNVSSLVSPISNWSGAWSMASGFGTDLSSPHDLVNPADLIPDDTFPVASDAYNDTCTGFGPDLASELPADVPWAGETGNLNNNPFLSFQPATLPTLPYAANLLPTGEPSSGLLDLTGGSRTQESNVCCSEIKSLAASAWDALQEHFVSSVLKIQQSRGNPLADKLCSMSTKTIATTGLRALRSLLDGDELMSSLDAVCFVHLMYSFSLVIHGQGTSNRAKDLYMQSLAYAAHLPPAERDLYAQVAASIWQPAGFVAESVDESLSRSSSVSSRRSGYGAQDARLDVLLATAYNFLDGRSIVET